MKTDMETHQALADRVLHLGTGMQRAGFIAHADHEPLLAALAAMGADVARTSGTVSFVHGRYTAPWTREVISGAGYDLAVTWSENAATGADNGVRVSGDCPQWRANNVALVAILAASGMYFAAACQRELEDFTGSAHPEEAAAARALLAALPALADHSGPDYYQVAARAVTAPGDGDDR
jgi:hypothetical protein